MTPETYTDGVGRTRCRRCLGLVPGCKCSGKFWCAVCGVTGRSRFHKREPRCCRRCSRLQRFARVCADCGQWRRVELVLTQEVRAGVPLFTHRWLCVLCRRRHHG